MIGIGLIIVNSVIWQSSQDFQESQYIW
jgi:hypothetical protein